MQPRLKLTPGSHVRWDGDTHTIEAFVGSTVRLRSSKGKLATVMLTHLVAAEGFSVVVTDSEEDDESSSPTFLDNVPAAALNAARDVMAHLLEAETGYRSGSDQDIAKGEPRPGYDPQLTTKTQRYRAKAKELKKGLRTVWDWKRAYVQRGLYGLVDLRVANLTEDRVDIRVKKALDGVLDRLVDLSTVSIKQIRRLTQTELDKEHRDAKVKVPPESTFQRLVKRQSKGRGLLLSAKTRRGNANRPKGTYSHFTAMRPGELILIDSTPLDAFAMDPYTFQWIQVQLTIAYDLCTRSIVAWRFTPVSTKAVDAALLLYDIIRPKWAEADWEHEARWAYVGVPESVIVEIVDDNSDRSRLAGVPFLHPESVLVDRGRVFLSEAFSDACTRLEINLFLARPYTPTDKAHVERVFRSIRESFVEKLPGYKGPDIYSRGRNAEGDAFFFLDEIERRFAEWVALYWQRRHHDGLELPNLPHFRLSPNDMFEEGIAKAGFVYVVPDERLYYDLLPTQWRTVQHYGVEVRGLKYDGDILNDYRNRKSPYQGVNAGKWPIRYDPRDYSRVFFYDIDTETWHELLWIGRQGAPKPFNERTLRYAKTLLLASGGNPSNEEELNESLNRLLDRMDNEVLQGRKERHLAAVNAMHAQQATKDRPSKYKNPDDEANVGFVDGPITRAPDEPVENSKTKRPPNITLYPTMSESEDDDDDLVI